MCAVVCECVRLCVSVCGVFTRCGEFRANQRDYDIYAGQYYMSYAVHCTVYTMVSVRHCIMYVRSAVYTIRCIQLGYHLEIAIEYLDRYYLNLS